MAFSTTLSPRTALLLPLIAAAAWVSAPQPDDRPNVLLIVADDLGFQDLGFQGASDIRSPNLDRLAAESVRFTDGHTTASVCSPSRAGLMTGRYQQRFGHEANSPPAPHGMDLEQTTIAQEMKDAGYRTGIVGKWHLGTLDTHYPTARGFDYFYGLRAGGRGYFHDPSKYDQPDNNRRIEENGEQVAFDGYLTDVFGDKAVEFIDQDPDTPFFLYLSFTAPHTPMHATEEDLARFEHIEDTKRRTYAAMIWAMDRAIGEVLSRLESLGVADDTLVWFLSDNGGATVNASSNAPLAGHKGIKFEGGIRVPFTLRWTSRLPGGRDYAPMVSALDILPTSVTAAGGDAVGRRPLDGVDLLPHLLGEVTAAPHERLYWHKLWFSAMRDGPWKLIQVQDHGHALYNLDDDLAEKHNLAPTEPERVAEMTADLEAWKRELAQPSWNESKRWFRIHSKNHIKIIEGRDGR